MSYEGRVEYLCLRGHYQVRDAFSDAPRQCGLYGCEELIWLSHDIDDTNGYDADDPSTCTAPKVPVGWDDVARQDHYHNKYFVKNERYVPAPGSKWKHGPTKEELDQFEAEQVVLRDREKLWQQHADKHRIFVGNKLHFVSDDKQAVEHELERLWKTDVPDDVRVFGPDSF